LFRRYQLILNYCFGHPRSSLLLFPSSSSVQFINHSSKKSNAKIQWSDSDFQSEEWLTEPLEEIKARKKTGLMFDIIATKDIQLGEEVLLDYGGHWEDAWEEHLQGQTQIKDNFETTTELNNDPNSIVRTLEEQWSQPYSPDTQTICIFKYADYESDIYEGDHLDTDALYYKSVEWKMMHRWGFEGTKNHRPCDIHSRQRFGNHDFYTARMHNYDRIDDDRRIPNSLVLVVTKIPRWAI